MATQAIGRMSVNTTFALTERLSEMIKRRPSQLVAKSDLTPDLNPHTPTTITPSLTSTPLTKSLIRAPNELNGQKITRASYGTRFGIGSAFSFASLVCFVSLVKLTFS